MRQALRQAFETLEIAAGVLGAGLVDLNGNVVHAVGAHGGRDARALAVHLPRAEPTSLERTLGSRFEEEVLSGPEVVLVVRRLLPERLLVYLLVADGHPLGPLRHRLAECAETVRVVMETPSGRSERKQLEDVREFGAGPWIGQER